MRSTLPRTWTRRSSPSWDGYSGPGRSSRTASKRCCTSIYIDPADPNRAYLSYSGYNLTTPATPGHVFRVDTNAATTATWTDLSTDLADLPITDLVYDKPTGDLFASSDFGVLRRAGGTTTWTLAAPGMPNVEVAGLTIVPGEVLYAATHGRSAWRLKLS